MAIDFMKFPSIRFHPNKADKFRELDIKEWVVTEKIHGANFQIAFEKNGGEIHIFFFSRSQQVDLSFYKIGDSVDFQTKTMPNLIGCVTDMMSTVPGIETVRFFGELYGGNVQKGVYYNAASKDYIVFDCVMSGDNQQHYWLNKTELELLEHHYQIPICKVLFRGTFDECLEYPNEFPSTLTTVPLDWNTCEGVVIQPEVTCWFQSGGRVAMKSKNAKFSEKQVVKKEKKPVELTPEELEDYLEISSFMNDNVYECAISKYDRELSNFGPIMKEIFADLEEKLGKPIKKSLWKKINKPITERLRELLR